MNASAAFSEDVLPSDIISTGHDGRMPSKRTGEAIVFFLKKVILR